MADSNITLSSLTITPGFGQTFAKWDVDDPNVDGLPYLKYAAGELCSATANDRADVSFAKVAEGLVDAIHVVNDGMARWYWVKARNVAGGYGEFYPSSATGGVAAAATASIGTNGYLTHPNGVIEQWGEESTAFTNFSFSIPFPNHCLNVQVTLVGPGISDRFLSVSDFDVGIPVFLCTCRDAANNVKSDVSFYWRAIGY